MLPERHGGGGRHAAKPHSVTQRNEAQHGAIRAGRTSGIAIVLSGYDE